MGEEREEEFETGRRLALVARRNRELYESVKMVARQRGKKVSDVMEEALKLWHMYATLEEVDPKALVAGIAFVEHMLDFAIRVLANIGAVFTSEFIQSQLETIAQLRASATPQTPTPQEKPSEKPSVSETLKEQLRLQLQSSMIPIVIGILKQMLANLSKTTGVEIPISTPSISTPVKVEE